MDWILGEVSLDTYRKMLIRANTIFSDYGLHHIPERAKFAVEPLDDTWRGDIRLLHDSVSKTWEMLVSRLTQAFQLSPAIGERTFIPELVARVLLCSTLSIPNCDIFTTGGISVVTAALNDKHDLGVVFPMGIAGRTISNIPAQLPRDLFLPEKETWQPIGAVKDDSVFRTVTGDNVFPTWIHDLAEWCMMNSDIPIFAHSIANPKRSENGGVLLWCLKPDDVIMCSSISVRHFWLAAKCITVAKKLADSAQAGLDEAIMLYLTGNIWEIVTGEAIGYRVPIDLPPSKTQSRATRAVVFIKQIAFLLREYSINGRLPESDTDSRGD